MMRSPTTASLLRRAAIVLTLTIAASPTAVHAEGAAEHCLAQGYRPGTAGYFHCIETTESAQSSGLDVSGNGDAGSILRGTPDNAVTDYSGSSMEGATKPDPNILKQFNPGATPRQ